MNNNELYHFGILGQKWGVRRYQNPDGTLTEAGKKHDRKIRKDLRYYQVTGDKISKRKLKKKIKEASSKQYLNSLTDEELAERIDRITVENKYKELVGMNIDKPQQSVGSYLRKGGKEGIQELTKSAITKIGESYLGISLKKNEAKAKEKADTERADFEETLTRFKEANRKRTEAANKSKEFDPAKEFSKYSVAELTKRINNNKYSEAEINKLISYNNTRSRYYKSV